ncbi:MAG: hypothetical protein JNK82_13090 [Myxococcaceae bacterium]|nr:hypothetical protein [Myxococcaceae bacterium]
MVKLDLYLTTPVHASQATEAPVIISGAPPNVRVTVKLEQTRGKDPLFGPKTKQVRTDGSGGAVVKFTLRLKGPTPAAVLVTSATDEKDTTYPVDADSVEVLA